MGAATQGWRVREQKQLELSGGRSGLGSRSGRGGLEQGHTRKFLLQQRFA